MLIGNYCVLNKSVGRRFGGNSTALASGIGSGSICGLPVNFGQTGPMRNFAWPDMNTDVLEYASVPSGYGSSGWLMPMTAGGMSSHYNIDMGFTLSPGQLIPALNAQTQIDWSITINQAAMALVTGGQATINFSLDIDPAPNLVGSLAAAASIPFDFSTTAFLGAINGAGATLSMGFTINATATGKGFISASITNEGEAVTPTSVAAAVWNALTAAYSASGSFGEAMAAAGAAGDPWITNLPGAYAAGSAGNIIGLLESQINTHTDSAVAGIDTTSLKYAIESLHPSHQGFGAAYFWDYINGSDANDGLTPTTGKSTWAAVEALVQSGAGDTIYVLPDPGSSQITIDQRINITKASLNLRGPGRTVKIKPSSGTGDTITIGAVNVSVKGFVIEGATGDITGSSILINDKFARIEDNWINRHGYGIRCRAGDYHAIVNNTIEYHSINGMYFDDAGFATPGSPREAFIQNNTIYYNSVDGIHFADTTGTSTRLNILSNNRVHHNGRYGIYVGEYVQRTIVHSTNYVKDNGTVVIDPTTKAVTTGGDPDPRNEIVVDALASDTMVDTMNQQIEQISFNEQIVVDSTNGSIGIDYPIGTGAAPVSNIPEAQEIAVIRGFNKLFIKGDYIFSASENVTEYHIHGEGATLNATRTKLTFTSGNVTTGAHFYNIRIVGPQGGETNYHECIIEGLSNAHCHFDKVGFLTPSTYAYTVQHSSTIGLGHITDLHDCYSDEGTPIIDRNGTRLNQRYINYAGNIKFINQNRATDSGTVWLNMNGGTVTIDSSCTTGTFVITGNCVVVNSGTSTVDTTGVTATPATILDAAATTPIAANIKKVNDVTVTGVGTNDNPWNPA